MPGPPRRALGSRPALPSGGPAVGAPLPVEQDMARLPEAGAFEEMVREYHTMGCTPQGHVMAYIRESLGETC